MVAFAGEGLMCVRGGRLVFAGLDFAVHAGGALVLSGANGAGKSSLLRLMAGLGIPAAGRLAWGEVPITDDPAAHAAKVHYLGHLDAVKPALTVAESLSFWAQLRDQGQTLRAPIDAALEAFGLARLSGLPVRFLSQGQRRRLSLARLLVSPAPLWLLDEPRAALDHQASAVLDRLIARHRADGGRVVLALHGSDDPPGADRLDLGRFAPASPS
jgi:heme exporter protein A